MKEKVTNFFLLAILLALNTFIYDLLAKISVWVAYIIGGVVLFATFSFLISSFFKEELHPLKSKWNVIIVSFPIGFILWLLIK